MVFPVVGAVCRPPLANIDEGLKEKSMLKRFALLCWCLIGANALAAGPNANIKYYGYDWLDFYETATPSFSATEALKAIPAPASSMTNLNVVHVGKPQSARLRRWHLRREHSGWFGCGLGIAVYRYLPRRRLERQLSGRGFLERHLDGGEKDRRSQT
ncbi:hypothetical protein M8494_05700 [Serratia ureilytica]